MRTETGLLVHLVQWAHCRTKDYSPKQNDDKHKSFISLAATSKDRRDGDTFISKCVQLQAESFSSIHHSKVSCAYNLLCRITLFVSGLTSLTAHNKHWHYLGLVGSRSPLCSNEKDSVSTVFVPSPAKNLHVLISMIHFF